MFLRPREFKAMEQTCAAIVWASCAATVVLPTPPFPLRTSTMCLTCDTPAMISPPALVNTSLKGGRCFFQARVVSRLPDLERWASPPDFCQIPRGRPLPTGEMLEDEITVLSLCSAFTQNFWGDGSMGMKSGFPPFTAHLSLDKLDTQPCGLSNHDTAAPVNALLLAGLAGAAHNSRVVNLSLAVWLNGKPPQDHMGLHHTPPQPNLCDFSVI
jgi:hypothetical protein